jgi:hypothetical protein
VVALHPKNTRPGRKPFWIVYDELTEFKRLTSEGREEDIRRPQGMQKLTKTQIKREGLIMKTQNRYRYYVLMVGLIAVMVVSGCGQTQVKTVSEYGGKLPRPDRILVYDFATSPDNVDTSKGVIADLKHLVKKTPRTKEEKAVGRHVANALSKELVKEIQNFGLPAERAAGKPPATGKILEIEGQFLSIDEGNQTERIIIGFGAGRTDVKTNVQVLPKVVASRGWPCLWGPEL